MTRWIRRRDLLDERPAEERSNEAPDVSPIEACIQTSLFGGTFLRLDKDGTALPEDSGHERFRARKNDPWSAEVLGFNIHAGVVIEATDRAGLERLCRYGARPCFSLERLSLLDEGRVAYRLRKPRTKGATHLVLSPVQFLARIAALVPPPRFPLVRFAGVLAPNSTWRRSVVPEGPRARATAPRVTERKRKKKREKAKPSEAKPRAAHTSLGDGVVPADGARIDWATLLRRIHLEDVLACPCGGRRRIIAEITERDAIVAILAHVGLATDAPPIARARDPSSCEAA
jgi:hypothetical protein